ncbi:nucleotidyltransferase family protein [Campylobacter novaezeelandiae]|uniref:nucleotidyltransferase family protein n=2 Tax=Campylobacter novaezeelandiae TaxID=2267891 RepID=UPI001905E87F|nr:nucleotidyltransferase family protein [Campylobacter novaezeelandiae]MBK1963753.1 nucleotidyltransferase family protein [Campylobacter novaezeelandiae]
MDVKKLKLSPNSSIKEALNIVGKERVRLGIVVDQKDKFLGVISDSDIRKALINGKMIHDCIEDIYTKNPIVIKENTNKAELLELSSKTDIYDFPVVNEKGKVVSIRSISSLLAKTKLPNYVILMAGGLGSRLKELTKHTPKPMLKVGKKPILESIVSRLSLQNFENFIFCVNYKRQIIEDYFKDGMDFGVKISYVKEKKKLGTAGALSLLDKPLKESFIVMNADILTELDFLEFLKAHEKSKALMSVCVREFKQSIPYGVIEEKNGFIKNIKEKPVMNFLVSAGIYALKPEVLNFFKKNEYLDMPDLIKILMQKNERINTFLLRDYWIDIGRIEEFARANEDFR